MDESSKFNDGSNNDLLKRLLADDARLSCLTKTTDLKGVGDDEKWIWLKKIYVGCEQAGKETFSVISVINSILTQNQRVFCLSRDTLSELVRQDPQNKSKTAFANSRYKVVIGKLVGQKIIKLVEAKEGAPSVYEVIDESILRFLANVNRETQLKRAQEFTSKAPHIKKTGDASRDRLKDEGQDVEKVNYNTGENLENAGLIVKEGQSGKRTLTPSDLSSVVTPAPKKFAYGFSRRGLNPENPSPVARPPSQIGDSGYKKLIILMSTLESDLDDDHVVGELLKFYRAGECRMEIEDFFEAIDFKFSPRTISQRLRTLLAS